MAVVFDVPTSRPTRYRSFRATPPPPPARWPLALSAVALRPTPCARVRLRSSSFGAPGCQRPRLPSTSRDPLPADPSSLAHLPAPPGPLPASRARGRGGGLGRDVLD